MGTKNRFTAVATLAGLGVLVTLGACGGDDGGNGMTGPDPTGSVEVSVSTSGDQQDDGYTVTLDGGDGQPVDPNDTVTFDDVPTGEHAVELSGVAENCSVDGGNSRAVEVEEDATAEASFEVACTSGDLEASVTTSDEDGVGPDSYTLTLDDGDGQSVGPNGSVNFTDLPTGDHTLELSGLGDNCAVEGENPRTVDVSEGSNTESIDVSCAAPVSQVITFSSRRDGNWEIYLMNDDGTDPQNLTDDPDFDIRPMTSEDGSRIAFTSNRDGSLDVWTMLPDGDGLQNLTQSASNDDRPAWFPEGDRIAFVSNRDGNEEIYVMDSDGSNVTRLTENDALDTHPAVSPNGERIAFVSDRDGNEEIYVMDSDGSNVTRITDDPAADRRPAWSPNGSRIAFFTDRDGDFEIYAMDAADGSNLENLTNAPGATDQEPAFSPDGNRIGFASDRDGDLDIWVMDADGSNPENLTPDSDAADEDPAWDN